MAMTPEAHTRWYRRAAPRYAGARERTLLRQLAAVDGEMARLAERRADLAALIMRERAQDYEEKQMPIALKRVVMIAVAVFGLATAAQAQTATPTSRLAWDQPAGSLAEAQALSYEGVYDGNPAPVAVTAVACAGTASPFQCAGAFPALTPGPHTVALQARNAAGASPLSAVFNFAFVALPSAPTNLRIVTGG